MEKRLLVGLLTFIFLGFSGVINAKEKLVKNRHEFARVMGYIREKHNQEWKKLQELRKKDIEAFRAKIKALHEKVREEIRVEREKFKKLVIEYRKTKDPKILKSIKKYVSDAYDRSLNAAAKRIAEQKKRLEEAEKRLEARKAKKEKRINKKLKMILKDPKLNW